MNREREATESFKRDALRMAEEAKARVNLFNRRSPTDPAAAEDVKAIFHVIHSLKGTASMLSSGKKIVETLHGIEGILSCRSLEDSARDRRWAPVAYQALQTVHQILWKMDVRTVESRSNDRVDYGFLIQKATNPGSVVWVPMQQILGVLPLGEVLNQPWILFQGEWIPVISYSADAQAYPVALVIAEGSRRKVWAAVRVSDMVSHAEAQSRNLKRAAGRLFESATS